MLLLIRRGLRPVTKLAHPSVYPKGIHTLFYISNTVKSVHIPSSYSYSTLSSSSRRLVEESEMDMTESFLENKDDLLIDEINRSLHMLAPKVTPTVPVEVVDKHVPPLIQTDQERQEWLHTLESIFKNHWENQVHPSVFEMRLIWSFYRNLKGQSGQSHLLQNALHAFKRVSQKDTTCASHHLRYKDYTRMLMLVGTNDKPDQFHQVAELMLQSGFAWDIFIINLSFKLSMNALTLDKALYLLEKIKNEGLTPDDFTISMILSAMNKNKDYEGILAFYRHVTSSPLYSSIVRLNAVHCKIIIAEMARQNDIDSALNVLASWCTRGDDIIQRQIVQVLMSGLQQQHADFGDPISMYNYVRHYYKKRQHTPETQTSMRNPYAHDTVCLSLAAYLGLWDEVKEAFALAKAKKMTSKQPESILYDYCTVIQAAGFSGNKEVLMMYHKELEACLMHPVLVARKEQVQEILQILNRDAILFSSYYQVEDNEEARKHLMATLASHPAPKTRAFDRNPDLGLSSLLNTFIEFAMEIKDDELIQRLMDEMVVRGGRLNKENVTALLSRSGEWERFRMVCPYQPRMESAHTILSFKPSQYLRQGQDLIRVLKNQPPLEDNERLWNHGVDEVTCCAYLTLMSMYVRSQPRQSQLWFDGLAKDILQAMKQVGVATVFSVNLLLNHYRLLSDDKSLETQTRLILQEFDAQVNQPYSMNAMSYELLVDYHGRSSRFKDMMAVMDEAIKLSHQHPSSGLVSSQLFACAIQHCTINGLFSKVQEYIAELESDRMKQIIPHWHYSLYDVIVDYYIKVGQRQEAESYSKRVIPDSKALSKYYSDDDIQFSADAIIDKVKKAFEAPPPPADDQDDVVPRFVSPLQKENINFDILAEEYEQIKASENSRRRPVASVLRPRHSTLSTRRVLFPKKRPILPRPKITETVDQNLAKELFHDVL